MSDTLTSSLQESVLSLIATNDVEGKIATGLLEARVFDDAYRDIAERILEYRKNHGKAPGVTHLDDLVDDIIGNKRNKRNREYIRILDGIIHTADGLNSKYVLSRLSEFTERQRLKAAILEAGDIYQAGKENLVDDVKSVLNRALKPRDDAAFDGGTFLNTAKALNFLESTKADYLCGIKALDDVNCAPTRGTLLMLMAAKGAGKSWWCIDLGKRCLMQRARVLHISLEMSEERVVQRYFQSFFAIGKREEAFKVTRFKRDKLGRLVGFRRRTREIEMSLDSPKIKTYLRHEMGRWGRRLNRLVVKSFPTRSLTVPRLEAYLDALELRYNFIPTVIIVDYPDLMKIDTRDFRINLGTTVEDLRGLFQRRNVAGICPTQTNRKGWDASQVKGSMVGEDASKFKTADMVLTMSRTEQEKNMGLARVFIEKNRDDEDGFSVVISQAYKTGQFVISSVRMSNNYFDLMPQEEDQEGEEDD